MSTWLLPQNELTPEQLRAVELNHADHQVIFGAPGSGKTQILLHRAAFLRQRLGALPGRFRIFVYTNVLKQYIRAALKLLDLPEDAVITWDDWCKTFYLERISRKTPWDAVAKKPDFEAIRSAVADKLAKESMPPLYDFVLVDEAQDLDAATFGTIRRMSRHITVCLDNKQQIYERGSNESDILGILGLRRRNMTLLDAYRCSPFVARLASHFIPDPQDARQYLGQVRTAQTERQTPLLFKAETFDEEKHRLIEVLRERLLIDQRIGIFFPQRRQVFGFAQGLAEAGIEVEVPHQIGSKQSLPLHDFSTSRPKLMAYHSAKGLTFDSVLLPRLVSDSFARVSPERVQRLLFVAVTRATRWVYLSTQVGNELTALQSLQPLVTERALTVQSKHDRTPPSAKATPGTSPATDKLDFL